MLDTLDRPHIPAPILDQLFDVASPDSDLLIDATSAPGGVQGQGDHPQPVRRPWTSTRRRRTSHALLISLFKLSTGTTPHQFQIAMRVELARALLEEQLPLCEVAARAGFADQSHLNRHFRRRYGFTPGVFREAVVMRPSIVV
jgi:hypothetical protein